MYILIQSLYTSNRITLQFARSKSLIETRFEFSLGLLEYYYIPQVPIAESNIYMRQLGNCSTAYLIVLLFYPRNGTLDKSIKNATPWVCMLDESIITMLYSHTTVLSKMVCCMNFKM